MTGHSPQSPDAAPEGESSVLPDWAVAVLTIEAIAVLIGLAMPITPSKTGSMWRPSELLWAEPTYLKDAAVYFVATNVLIVLLLAVAWGVHAVRR